MIPQDKINFLKELIFELHNITELKVEITETTELHELGLDSLDVVELQMMYEDKTKQSAKDPTSAVNTVKDLLDLMD